MNVMAAHPKRDVDAAPTIAAWHDRPAQLPAGRATNAISIDVEDYFQVEAFFGVIDRANWDTFECRVERNIDVILDLLATSGSRATFFTLAWIAERYPAVVRKIVANGHELASHGSDHRRADTQTYAEFFADVAHAKRVLEDLGGTEVKGYRAPSFSVMRGNLWALEALASAGYRYSSSINPIAHDNYGIPEAPRFAFHPFAGDPFLEIPVTSLRLFGRNWPCGGGGFFRLLPYPVNSAALSHVMRRDRQPCVFYFHPWEVDAGQPRIHAAGPKSRFRHYLNLRKMQPRLARLMKDYSWGRVDEIFLPSPIGATVS
jgi:polysaccharide deacetylase family protein (PEP-CTERM system associated)